MRRTAMEMNYERFMKVLNKCDSKNLLKPLDDENDDLRNCHLKSDGFMDLVVEYLYSDEGWDVYSMAHYYVQEGDLMSDPEMEIRVNHGRQMAEAITITQSAMGEYQQVYFTREDGTKLYNPRLQKELQEFLTMWLNNINIHGYLHIK